ncbi:MAG: IS1 family transposase [Vicinamibacteria bacterium]
MNRLSNTERAKVVAVLVEGNSLRATARITGVARMTVEKILRDLGTACEKFHNETVRNVRANRIECDEIWSFVGSKQKNVPASRVGLWGDVWTWTAIDPDSKLIVSYLVGARDSGYAQVFMIDVADRLANRVQLTTDGHRVYLNAVADAFGNDIDFAMLEKHYGPTAEGQAPAAVRYSPARLASTNRVYVSGSPDPTLVSTSIVERQNLTMRMHMRRFTRLTNGFSKKIENHAHAVAIHFAYYNFCKIHMSLRVTPAMEAGISDRVWSVEELVGLIDVQR